MSVDRAPEDPQPGEEVFFHGHPSWQATLDLYAKGIVAAVIAGAVAGFITALAAGHVHVGWIVLAVLVVFVLALLAGALARIRTTYTITSQRLTIRRGLLSHEVHETRLERVQNVNSSQSILERLLRVGNVDFDTAGSAKYDFSFRGVANPREIMRTVDRALHESSRLPRV